MTAGQSTYEDACRALTRAIHEKAGAVPPGRYFRLEQAIPDTDPLAWLDAHPDQYRIYCGDREGSTAIASVGCADILRYKTQVDVSDVFSELKTKLSTCGEGARYYGGFRFSRHHGTGRIWRRFGSANFILPELELIREDGGCRLAVNLGDGGASAVDRIVRRLEAPATIMDKTDALPAVRRRRDSPGRRGWNRMIRSASAAIRKGRLEKIVLARRSMFTFAGPVVSLDLLKHMKQATSHCYHFFVSYGDEFAFIGATPERLYRRVGQTVESEAIAGTRPRGRDEEKDRGLAEALLASEKDRHEHELVVRAIRDGLGRLCRRLEHDPEPCVLKLDRVQHLKTGFRGELEPGCDDGELLAALHPTPAVGGYPRHAAIDEIARIEPFDRGWYAGPVGWIGRDQAEFAVAIRCLLVAGKRMAVYAGAGIVEQSDADDEWREIDNKMANVLRFFEQP